MKAIDHTRSLFKRLSAIACRYAAVLFIAQSLSSAAHAASPSQGAQIFQTHCTACHGEDGAGAMPGMPDFRRGDGLMQPDRTLADHIRFGKTVMPAFQGILSDDDIYDVIAYLRTLR